MRHLLDTNILVFMLSGETDSISNDVQMILSDFSNRLYVSSLSVMELINLHRINKVKTIFKTTEELLAAMEDRLYLAVLQTKPEHIDVYARLQPVDGHKDQIDHFIIAQSICEKMPLISSDRKFFSCREQRLDFIYNRR